MDEIYGYGVDDFYFGIESGSQRMLDLMCKDISAEDIIKAINIIKNYTVKAVFSFLLGYPGEDQKDIQYTLSLASYMYNNVKNCEILMNIFTVYPGTYFFLQFKEGLKAVGIDFHNWYTARGKPWIKNKVYIETICTLFRFLNLPPFSRHFGILKIPFIFILHKLAHLRVKYNLFKYPLEFTIANYFIQRHKMI